MVDVQPYDLLNLSAGRWIIEGYGTVWENELVKSLKEYFEDAEAEG
jgi:hypothetical protein